MREAADVLNGITCQVCGQFMPECFVIEFGQEVLNKDFFDNPPGHPQTCPDCLKDE